MVEQIDLSTDAQLQEKTEVTCRTALSQASEIAIELDGVIDSLNAIHKMTKAQISTQCAKFSRIIFAAWMHEGHSEWNT
jgi:hypothetical protein